MKYSKQVLAVTIALVLAMGVITVARQNNSNQEDTVVMDTGTIQTSDMPLVPSHGTIPDMMNPNETQSTDALLLYLIEEEKLAHDVCTVMYEQFGANVFGNIPKSESMHQARSIPDPTSDQIGVFTNQELQELYNKQITQSPRLITVI